MCCPHLCRACTSTHVTLRNLTLFSPLSWYESFLLRLMDEKELSGILGTPENSKRWLHSLIFTVLNGQPVQDSAHQLRYVYVTPIPCEVFPTCTSSWPPLHRQHPASFPSLKGNSCLLGAIECIGEWYWKIFGKDDPHHFGVVRPEGILLETTVASHVITVFPCLRIIKLFQMNDLHEHMDKKSSLKFHVHEYFWRSHVCSTRWLF